MQVGERLEQDSVTKAALGFALRSNPQPETHAIPRPVQPPTPAYPYCALEHAIEGQCTIFFDVSKTGLATDIQALCTHGIFVRDAERAVSRAKFSPATVNGEPVYFPGMAYPMVFKITINTEEVRVER